jgi:hypothetical protein
MEEKHLDRIADALERIVDLMEAEEARRKRRTLNEIKDNRASKRSEKK